jgi:hypothetical protein
MIKKSRIAFLATLSASLNSSMFLKARLTCHGEINTRKFHSQACPTMINSFCMAMFYSAEGAMM